MFVQYLNERQQGVLLHYADRIMRVDGAIDAKEMVHIDALREQAAPGAKAEDLPVAELPRVFEDRSSRIAFLLELVGMGYANEAFDPKQSGLVADVSAAFSLKGDMDDVESWVKRQFELVREARGLMEG